MPAKPPKPTSVHNGARRITREPRWRPQGHFTRRQLDARARLWLTDDGSLTERLISLRRGTFSVQRLYQGWQVPLPSERLLLEIPQRQVALIREVALQLDGNTVVFARSVFPHASLQGSLGHLRKLQNKSLGAILFKHPGMHRRPFELARIPGDSPYLPRDLQQASPAWGRRSCFDLEGKKLLVSEVFLESFSPWPSAMAVHRSQRGKVNAAFVSSTQ